MTATYLTYTDLNRGYSFFSPKGFAQRDLTVGDVIHGCRVDMIGSLEEAQAFVKAQPDDNACSFAEMLK